MSGRLTVVGLGPGPDHWMTPAASNAIADATHVLGYMPYVKRLKLRAAQTIEASDNREELARAERALFLAQTGARVALVSGGDPGVFAMAAAVFEAIDRGPQEWRELDVTVEPGVTAMLAAAARAGAPLGHDFCAISLSDNLKPWPLIEKRLRLASEASFAIALYNPASKARPQGIHQAFAVLRDCLPAETVVVLAHAVGREGEGIEFTSLATAPLDTIAMHTLLIVGSRETRVIDGQDGVPRWVYTPRSAAAP